MVEPDERWMRWLAGERRTPEAAELARSLAGDRAQAEACAADVATDGELRALLAPARDADEFTRVIAARLAAERDGSRFLRSVRSRLREEPRRRRASSVRLKLVRRRLGVRVSWAALLAAGVLLVVGGGWLLYQQPPAAVIGEVVALRGPSTISDGNSVRPTAIGGRLAAGERIVTADGERDGAAVATVVLGGGIRCDLAAGSTLEIVDRDAVRLRTGRIYAQVEHRASTRSPAWRVLTGAAELTITGTRFEVEATATETILRLEEGSVTVANRLGKQQVPALHECRVVVGAAPAGLQAISVEDIWRAQRSSAPAAPAPSATPPPPTASVIPSGLRLWLDAAEGVTLINGQVSAWRDRQGGRIQAVQPIAGQRPVLVPDAHAGRPALRFDGAETFMMLDATDILDDLVQTTVVVRARCPAALKDSKMNEMFGADSGHTEHSFDFGVRHHYVELWAWSGSGPKPSHRMHCHVTDPEVWHHYAYRADARGHALFIDGRLMAPVYVNGAPDRPFSFAHAAGGKTRYSIGTSVDSEGNRYAGDIAEVMVFDRALSDAEIADLAARTASQPGR